MRIKCSWKPFLRSAFGLAEALSAMARTPGLVVQRVTFRATKGEIVCQHGGDITRGDLARMVADPLMGAVQAQVSWEVEA